MQKYYFTIEGINKELENENEAGQLCNKIQEFLHFIGFQYGDAYFSDENYFKNEHDIK